MRDAGCRIWVFEEGYLRPHWLTLEEGGINGFSSFPRDPKLLLTEQSTGSGEGVRYVPLRSAMRERVLYDFRWQLWNYVLRFRYPHYRTHRPFPIWAEYATWARRLVALLWRKRRATAISKRLIDSGAAYFVFPMQLDSDSQVQEHSPFANMTEALERVISSFASFAPAEALLVVKAHPLDNGWINFRRRTERVARRFGVAGRVVYLDGGDWAVLARGACGAVTLNSTAGLTALESEKPVICLGKAVYDIPGLTYQGSLDTFWTELYKPDQRLALAFKHRLARTCMINGNYYTAEGIALAVANAISRFEEIAGADIAVASDRWHEEASDVGEGEETAPIISRSRPVGRAAPLRSSVR
ncbi:MAG: capsular biosynthesis protein [Parvibaculum sp.]